MHAALQASVSVFSTEECSDLKGMFSFYIISFFFSMDSVVVSRVCAQNKIVNGEEKPPAAPPRLFDPQLFSIKL